MTSRSSLAIAGFGAAMGMIALAASWAEPQNRLPPPAVAAIAIDALERGEAGGTLEVAAAILPDLEDPDRALVVVRWQRAPLVSTSSEVGVTLVFDRFDAQPEVQLLSGRGTELGSSACWQFEVTVDPPDDLRETAVVVEAAGAWGSTPAMEEELAAASGCVIESIDLLAPAETDEERDEIVRLVPPNEPAIGPVRVRAVVTTEAVQRVTFRLDGETIANDERAPFSTRIDFGPEVRTRRLQVVAQTRDGLVLGEDEILVNSSAQPFAVTITSVEQLEEGLIDVDASVSLPPDQILEKVEFYLSETLHHETGIAPFRARIPAPTAPDGTEFVRVVAWLEDGTWTEAVHLLLGGGLAEEIEVNLVELYVVVTDKKGQPVSSLEADDFEVKGRRGARFRIERFNAAETVPLSLGLVIDTSESMMTLMDDTKRAAALFLSEMVTKRDTAFVVDFDNRPRLAQPLTSDIAALFRGLANLEADGFTTLYDAVVFGSLQFDDSTGRRALVLLTDGNDYRSRFSLADAVEQARASGAPIYLIAMGGFDDFRRDIRTLDLESVTARTGGRVFHVADMDEVADAYKQIAAELRSQYLVAFSTDAPLSDDDLRKIDVKVDRPGLKARVVVSPLR